MIISKKDSYKKSGLKVCDWLLNLQEGDGRIPWKVVATTGRSDGTDADAISTGWIIAAWVKAWEITKDSKYLKASKRLAEHLNCKFIQQNDISGYITDDKPSDGLNRWETPCSPAASCAIEGLSALYKVTKDDKYLEYAKQVGYLNSLWQWIWEPEPGLYVRIKGATQGSGGMQYTIDQVLGTELPIVIDGYLNLYEITRDRFWLNAAEMAIARMEDDIVFDRDDPRYGGIREGWNLNEDCDIDSSKDDPHVNIYGVAYFINNIERYLEFTNLNP